MKKVLSVFLVFIVFCLGIGLAGCGYKSHLYPEYESGYYKYSVKTEKDGTQKAYITGLTELGKQQTALIYPKTIDGIDVYGIGYHFSMAVQDFWIGNLSSENLQKFFMPEVQIENIKRAEIFNLHGKLVNWNSCYGDKLSNDEMHATVQVFGYNLYAKKKNYLLKSNSSFSIANVSYLYNYDNAPNDGYYWVDSYDKSLITFMPPKPTREGYTFEGWYKDADCINAWDFDTDITGKEINIDRETTYEKYDGIYLYAKWIKD